MPATFSRPTSPPQPITPYSNFWPLSKLARKRKPSEPQHFYRTATYKSTTASAGFCAR